MAYTRESYRLAVRAETQLSEFKFKPLDASVHHLGEFQRDNGDIVNAHVVHAVDAIITDKIRVVLIERANEPGQGLLALPGGFIDDVSGDPESVIAAAVRESLEEVGIKLSDGCLIGDRRIFRPFDVRVAWRDMPDRGISKGDLFLVTTQAVLFRMDAIPELEAGSDASYAESFLIERLAFHNFGIQDHPEILAEALNEI
jgi:8-oxo-dGTP pyrophosphatase MutT (NUDIX family)